MGLPGKNQLGSTLMSSISYCIIYLPLINDNLLAGILRLPAD
jgi:hypothetical protein